MSVTGLPNGLFRTQNQNLGKFWRVLQWKMMDTCSILRSFVFFYGHLVYVVRGSSVYFPPFWYFVPKQIWQPWCVRSGSPPSYVEQNADEVTIKQDYGFWNFENEIPARVETTHPEFRNFTDAPRVARWCIFKPSIPIWVNLGGCCIM
jgi:hypothetical protein